MHREGDWVQGGGEAKRFAAIANSAPSSFAAFYTPLAPPSSYSCLSAPLTCPVPVPLYFPPRYPPPPRTCPCAAATLRMRCMLLTRAMSSASLSCFFCRMAAR